MPAPRALTRTRPFLALAAVAALALPLAAPAAGAAAVDLRDVRAFACPPDRVPSAGFQDVQGNRLEIDCLAAYGITSGTGPGRYDPRGLVTRAQMALFVANTAAYAGVALDPRDAGFTDVAGLPPRFRDAVNGLANAGIVRGTSPTTFSPADSVTRGQMATFLTGLQARLRPAYPASRADYFDDDGGTTHEARINQLAEAGVVQGTAAATYSSNGFVIRQQMAAFLMRYLDGQIEAGTVRGKYEPRRYARMDGRHEGLRSPDPDGTARTVLSFDLSAGKACYVIEFQNIEIRLVEVRRYGSGEPVQRLYDEAPTRGPRVEGCKDEAADGLLEELRDHPDRFYVFATSYTASEEIAGPLTSS